MHVIIPCKGLREIWGNFDYLLADHSLDYVHLNAKPICQVGSQTEIIRNDLYIIIQRIGLDDIITCKGLHGRAAI